MRLDPIIKVKDSRVAIWIAGAAVAHNETSNPNQLVVVMRRSTRVAIAGAVILLVLQAETTRHSPVDLLRTVVQCQRSKRIPLQITWQIAIGLGETPARYDDIHTARCILCGKRNGAYAIRIDERRLDAQQCEIVEKVAVILVCDYLHNIVQHAAREAIIAAHPHTELAGRGGHIVTCRILVSHAMRCRQHPIARDDGAAAAVGAAITQRHLMRKLCLAGVDTANDTARGGQSSSVACGSHKYNR